MNNQTQREEIAHVIGKALGDLCIIAIISGLLIWAFEFTIPQGIVLGYLYYLLKDTIKSSNKL
jgi:hypothetical protein